MNRKIRILGIAPYSGMKELLQTVAQEDFSEEIDLVAHEGDLEDGVIIAKRNFHADFDIIISRGGTAEMLKSQVSLPVISIKLDEYDILKAIHLAENISDKIAVVGFRSVTNAVKDIYPLIHTQPEIFTLSNSDEVKEIMPKVAQQGYKIVICDVASSIYAKSIGLNCVLITSSRNSIHKAFQDAIDLYTAMRRLRSENLFLREIISLQSTGTVIFDAKENLIFSSMGTSKTDLLVPTLQQELANIHIGETYRLVKCLNRNLYTIKALKLSSENSLCTVFYIDQSRVPFSSGQAGIRFYSSKEAREQFYNSFFTNVNDILGNTRELEKKSLTAQPVMILGENGTGKESAANIIYMNYKFKNHPLVVIHADLLTEKSMNFLEQNYHSPFADSENTIYISGFSDSNYDKGLHLLSVIMNMDVTVRNKVIFSAAIEHNIIPEIAHLITDKLNCTILSLPSLHSMRAEIPKMINIYLSQANTINGKEILAMEDDGIVRMQNFNWQNNYAQFKRIMQDLVNETKGPVIRTEDVQHALSLEELVPAVKSVNGAGIFNMNRTLEEMDREIIQTVLRECNGNRTLAAKRLGISRTTVWKFASQD